MSSSSFLRDRGIFESAVTSAQTSGQVRSPRSRGSANGVKIRRVTKTNIPPNANNVPTNDNFDDDIESAGTIIVSVVENRAREICISKYDTTCGSFVEIYLLTDSHSYTETMATLTNLRPNEILLHDGCKQRILSQKIEERMREHTGVRILYVSRQYFDQDKGADFLKQVAVDNEADADLMAKYTVLAGTFCLLRYIENCEGRCFGRHSLRIVYCSSQRGRMVIDRRTAINLELISNARSGSQKDSLFGAINYTKTVVGARLLRSEILRPSTDLATLQMRLDCVESLIGNNKVFTFLVAILKTFPDLDKMLGGLAVGKPKQITVKNARQGIDTLIFLRQALKTAHSTAEVLDGLLSADDHAAAGVSGSHGQGVPGPGAAAIAVDMLVRALIRNLRAVPGQPLDQLRQAIDDTVTESTSFSKNSLEMRHQECFAIRAGRHGLLDLSRKTFLQCVEDIYQVAETYSKELGGVSVKVLNNATRGYYLSVPSTLDPLPAGFTQAVLNARTISCSTEEISSLSDRAAEALDSALTITHQLLQELMEQARQHMEHLFALTDSVALLDMLSGFADLVALSPHIYTRPRLLASNSAISTVGGQQQAGPTISDQHAGALAITTGRHAIISTFKQEGSCSSFVPNDCSLTPLTNMLVVSGPNGSGKTVFIKQVALIVVLAQIGCFVPAHQAIIPLRDRLLSRIGTSDDMEHNLSTFHTEMKESAYILENLTSRSLVIVDELGRGTSNIDGVSLAFAIAERLAVASAYTLFVTHYPQLTALADMYPNVANVHLKTSIDVQAMTALAAAAAMPAPRPGLGQDVDQQQQQHIKFLHLVGTGPCDMKSGYGLLMAEAAGFPAELVAEARGLQRAVRASFPLLMHGGTGSGSDGMGIGSGNVFDHSALLAKDLLTKLLLLRTSSLVAAPDSAIDAPSSDADGTGGGDGYTTQQQRDATLCEYLTHLRAGLGQEQLVRLIRYIQEYDTPSQQQQQQQPSTLHHSHDAHQTLPPHQSQHAHSSSSSSVSSSSLSISSSSSSSSQSLLRPSSDITPRLLPPGASSINPGSTGKTRLDMECSPSSSSSPSAPSQRTVATSLLVGTAANSTTNSHNIGRGGGDGPAQMSRATAVTAVIEARVTSTTIGDKRPRDGRDLGLDQEYLFDCGVRRPPVEADEAELCLDDFLQHQAPAWQRNKNNDIINGDSPVAVPLASTAATATAASSASMQTTHTLTTATTATVAPADGPGRPPITFKKFRSGALTTSASAGGGVGNGAVVSTPSPHPHLHSTTTTAPNPAGSRRSGRAVE